MEIVVVPTMSALIGNSVSVLGDWAAYFVCLCLKAEKAREAGWLVRRPQTVGMAWWYRRYANEQTSENRGQYEFAEGEAQAKRMGLWQESNSVPLWEWRKQRR